MTRIHIPTGLPTFPTVLLSSSPVFKGEINVPTRIGQQHDPFSARRFNDGNDNSFDISSNSHIGFSDHPVNALKILSRNFDDAREAILAGDVVSLETSLRSAVVQLKTPTAQGNEPLAKPLHLHLEEEGRSLLEEAALMAAGYSSSENIPESLGWLHDHINRSKDDGQNSLGHIKARLLRAYNVMRHATSTSKPQAAILRRAYKIAHEIDVNIDIEGDDLTYATKTEAHFYSKLLKIEILASQLVLACKQNNRAAREAKYELADSIRKNFQALRLKHCSSETEKGATPDPEKVEILAKYYADVALLMASLGMLSEALDRARTLTTNEKLRKTDHARRVLGHELFSRYVHIERGEIKQAGEIIKESSQGSVPRFLHAGVRNAHSKSFAQAAITGGAGLLIGHAVDALVQGGHGGLAALGGAVIFVGGSRIINGLRTKDALEAKLFQTSDAPEPVEIAKDMGRLTLRTGLDVLTWALPAFLLEEGGQPLLAGWNTLMNGYDIYAGWVSSAGSALTSADFYTSMPDRVYSGITSISAPTTPHDLINSAYNLYTKAAGALFAAHILLPGQRRRLSKISKWFLLGAIGLSADIRQAYKHDIPLLSPDIFHPDYFNGVLRASIVTAEAIGMMLIIGMVTWNKGKTRLETLGNFGSALWNADKNMAIAVAIINGITSPFGGAMQKDKYDQLSFVMMQGMATVIGVLPFTLLFSGLLKGKVPIGSLAKEAWQDTKGQPLNVRLAEASLGALDGSIGMRYAQNRVGRIPLYDLIGATARTYLEFDEGYLSQLAMSGPNLVAGNGASTLTWPEPSGTKWERAIVAELLAKSSSALNVIETKFASGLIDEAQRDADRAKVFQKIHMNVEKNGQRMDPLHLFREHPRLKSRFLPFYSIAQTISKDSNYPSSVEGNYYAGIHRMLKGGNIHELIKKGSEQVENLGENDADALLQYIDFMAGDSGSYKVLQPLVKTLAMARDVPEIGPMISEFLNQRPGLLDLLDMDQLTDDPAADPLAPPAEISRRRTRKVVMGRINTSPEEYRERVALHGRDIDIAEIFSGNGFFFTPPDPKKARVTAAEQAPAQPETRAGLEGIKRQPQ